MDKDDVDRIRGWMSIHDHKERMFLLIIIAVLSVRQLTQLVKAKNRKHA
jgi:hypothetical protein